MGALTPRRCNPEKYEMFIREHLDAALRPPAIMENPSCVYAPDVDDYTMSSGFARTPGGRIWLSWFGGEDNDEAVMLLASSDDGGRTFSAPRFLVDGGHVGRRTHFSTVVGNVWCDPLGRLWWFFMYNLGYFDGRGGNWAAVCENPDDARPVWSTPTRIGHGCQLNKPTVTRDGTWFLPGYLWPRRMIGIDISEGYWLGENSSLFPELDADRQTWIYASTDQGATWTRRGGTHPTRARTFDEPMLVERADGSLWMLLRTDEGMVATESSDQGFTWSEPVPFRQPNPSSRHFLTKLASGKLLLVHHASPDDPMARSHMAAWLSPDDGRTWEGGLLLDERLGVSYPDGFQAPDGLIHVQHDYKRRHGELVLSTFTEADVLAGRDVSGRVCLRHPMLQTWSMAHPDHA